MSSEIFPNTIELVIGETNIDNEENDTDRLYWTDEEGTEEIKKNKTKSYTPMIIGGFVLLLFIFSNSNRRY